MNPLILNGKLFKNIAETYKSDDGKIYATPLTFTVPIVIGYKDDLDKLNSLSVLPHWLRISKKITRKVKTLYTATVYFLSSAI